MESNFLRALETERARLLASHTQAATTFPRICIPGSDLPPVVLQNLSQPGQAVLIGGQRQPTAWPETYWLAGQSDGVYLAVLAGEAQLIRVTDGVVKTFVLDDIKRWHTVGRVARDNKGENLEHPDPAPPTRTRRGIVPGA